MHARKRSGILVTSRPSRAPSNANKSLGRPCSLIRPAVGLAMQPIRERSVVLPDPLGPFRTVTAPLSIEKLTLSNATNAFGLPSLNALLTSVSSIIATS